MKTYSLIASELDRLSSEGTTIGESYELIKGLRKYHRLRNAAMKRNGESKMADAMEIGYGLLPVTLHNLRYGLERLRRAEDFQNDTRKPVMGYQSRAEADYDVAWTSLLMAWMMERFLGEFIV